MLYKENVKTEHRTTQNKYKETKNNLDSYQKWKHGLSAPVK